VCRDFAQSGLTRSLAQRALSVSQGTAWNTLISMHMETILVHGDYAAQRRRLLHGMQTISFGPISERSDGHNIDTDQCAPANNLRPGGQLNRPSKKSNPNKGSKPWRAAGGVKSLGAKS
jgi:hypothetical protein